MIIPVGVNHVVRGWPRVTIAIIAACTLVHIYSVAVAPSEDEVDQQIAARLHQAPPSRDEALQPATVQDIERIASQIPSVRFGYLTGTGVNHRLLTSAFVHEDWLHLIGNMLFLWLAGAALEDRWGRVRFAAFYAAGAVASALCFSAFHQGDEVLLIGASGAISALMGAFLLNFARTQIQFVYLLFLRFGRFDASAYLALPLWFAEQVLYALLEGERGGVAFTAHIGGFAFGLAVAAVARLLGRARARAAATRSSGSSPATPRPVASRRRPDPAPPGRGPDPAPRPIEPPRPAAPRDPAEGPQFLA